MTEQLVGSQSFGTAMIQSALKALSTIGTGNVLVTVTAPNNYSRTIQLNFRNGKAGVNMAQTTIDVTGISIYMGGKTPFANTVVQGGAYSEVQTINLSNASSGQWRVAFNGEVSNALSVGISAADLKTALDNFVGIDNVTVTGSSGSFTVTFGGTQTGVNVSQLFGDASSASCGSTVQTITSSFNANDQLTSISDPNATINYTLDSLGRATAISNAISGLTPTVTLNQAFNAAGLRTELKATIGSTLDFKNSYQFDTLGRMTELIQQGQSGGNAVTAKRATFAYNVLNQRTLVSRYQSTGTTNAVATTEYSYDTLNRLSGLTHKQGSTVLSGYTYAYDGMSRLASVTSTIEGLSSYSYDATSQVVGADHASGGQADESYSFDANGNRNSVDYTVDTNNHIAADATFTYAYDDQGNRTSRTDSNTGEVTEYSWDHRNRLVTVKDRASSGGSVAKQVDYAYDAFNRLVKRTYDADGAGSGTATTQYWVYDEGINAVMQFDGPSSSNLSHRYLWTEVVDELMADEIVGSGADTQYALGDHLGTIRDIANFNESTSVTSVTNHRTYSSFGQLTAETNSAVDLIFGYTGKQLDDATGLQHNLFRWYDSALGQWLSEDPLGFAAGDENLKRYVGNTSNTKIDSLGLADLTEEELRKLLAIIRMGNTQAGSGGLSQQEIELMAYFHNPHSQGSVNCVSALPPDYGINQPDYGFGYNLSASGGAIGPWGGGAHYTIGVQFVMTNHDCDLFFYHGGGGDAGVPGPIANISTGPFITTPFGGQDVSEAYAGWFMTRGGSANVTPIIGVNSSQSYGVADPGPFSTNGALTGINSYNANLTASPPFASPASINTEVTYYYSLTTIISGAWGGISGAWGEFTNWLGTPYTPEEWGNVNHVIP